MELAYFLRNFSVDDEVQEGIVALLVWIACLFTHSSSQFVVRHCGWGGGAGSSADTTVAPSPLKTLAN